MATADEVEASMGRIGRSLTEDTGGFGIPEAYTEIEKEIVFIEVRHTFGRFEIGKLRTSVKKWFGPGNRQFDVDLEKQYAGSECAGLRAMAAYLRLRDET
jgi:hypothetical protein